MKMIFSPLKITQREPLKRDKSLGHSYIIPNVVMRGLVMHSPSLHLFC
jgi:hypothetical protein